MTDNVILKNRRWLIVIAGMSIIMCLGVAYAWGVFLLPISESTGWSRASISLAVSILLLTFSVFMAIGGILEKKIGPRITACLGGALVGIGWILASFSKTFAWLYITYGFLAGMGTGLSYLPSISTGIKWFPEKKATVTGLIIFGFGFGSAFLAPVGTRLISIFGWRTTMLIYGITFGTVIISASCFLRVPPAGWKPGTEKEKSEETEKIDLPPLSMIKTSTFWIIFATYFLALVAGMMAIGHIVPFLKDKGYTSMQAAFAITILAIFNGLGRIFSGALADKIGPRNVLVMLFILIGTMMFSLLFLPTLYLVYAVAGIIGLCFGGFLSVYPALTCECFGIEHFGINYGIVFIGYGLGGFTGPLLGGMVYDITGSYTIAFVSAGVMALCGGLVIFLNQRKACNQKGVSTR